jgi:adenylate kinase
VPQAKALDEMGVTLDRIVSIEVADEVIVERMAGRRVCSKCGATYHVLYNPSKDGVNCDECHEELTQRRDDAPEVVLSRLEVYHSVTEPLKEFYSEKGGLVLVDGVGSVDEISRRTLRALEV